MNLKHIRLYFIKLNNVNTELLGMWIEYALFNNSNVYLFGMFDVSSAYNDT